MAEKNNPAVSVIVAMYNAEKYIGECLESLLNQTFQDFEVIVFDDCSTDFSRQVVYSFLSKFDGRLKLFKLRVNSGYPGIPRNLALAEARGKYIYFLDSDDLLSAAALEELYICAEKFKADVVHCEKYFAFSDGDEINNAVPTSFHTKKFVTEPTLETLDIGERVKGFIEKKFLWWACNKLLRRQFLIENAIRFPEVNVFEDMIFAFKCIVAAKNYVRVPFVSYYYRRRKASLSQQARNAVDSSVTMIKVVAVLDEFMSSEKFFRDNAAYRYAVLNFFIKMRLEVIAHKFFVVNNYKPAELFEGFRDKVFSVNPESNVALTTYLFINATIFNLYAKQQEAQIKELQTQVSELKKIILEVVN